MIALVLYVALSFYFGRKNPMFYLILVFALQQGQAAFIDQSVNIGGKAIFSVYDQVFTDVLFVITTAIAIFLLKAKIPRQAFAGTGLVMTYLLYIVLLFVMSLATHYDAGEVFLAGRQLLYVSLSYFLWLAIFHSVTREQYEGFLRMLFYVTPVSAVLYILNSSGAVTIFNSDFIYQEIDGASGGTFFRDFGTIPTQLDTVFVICFLSLTVTTFPVPKWLVYVNMVILPIAMLFTFTRSILTGIIMQIVILLLLYAYANGSRILNQLLKVCFIVVLFLLPVYFAVQKIYPDAFTYFTERITEAALEKENDPNVNIRIAYLEKTIDITNRTSVLTGAGLNKTYYPELEAIGAWTADSTIPYFLYHTGWLGVMLLYVVLLFFIADGVLYFKRSGDWLAAYLCSGVITSTISSLLMGGDIFKGSVWTFMNLALYTVIRFNLWKMPASYIAPRRYHQTTQIA